MQGKFRVEELRPVRAEMTVSRDAGLGKRTRVSFFSLGGGTSISPETYDTDALYLGAAGHGAFVPGPEGNQVPFGPGDLLWVPGGTLCGVEAGEGTVYTEILFTEEITMNSKVTAGQAFALKDLISYEEGSIANLDVVTAPNMKYVLMAFDEGTGLTPHRAPGNAIVFALEGRAVIGYEGQDTLVEAGDCFRFEKNGLHSVTAQGRFKMALLLVVE